MDTSRFTVNRLARILAILFIVYISASLVIIIFPEMHFGKRVTRIYKRYISPGPFFTASRITNNNQFYLSWKLNGEWTTPINPPLIHYKNFFTSWNPTLMYRSRLERSIYEKAIHELKNSVDSTDSKPYMWSNSYFQKKYAPVNMDSIRIILIGNVTAHYKTETDTIQIITF